MQLSPRKLSVDIPFNFGLMQYEVHAISSARRLQSYFCRNPLRRMREMKTAASKGVLSLA
jgi:hypothetical protein